MPPTRIQIPPQSGVACSALDEPALISASDRKAIRNPPILIPRDLTGSSLIEREGHQRPSGDHRDILPTVDSVGDGGHVDLPSQVRLPQFLAGLGVEGIDITLAAA